MLIVNLWGVLVFDNKIKYPTFAIEYFGRLPPEGHRYPDQYNQDVLQTVIS